MFWENKSLDQDLEERRRVEDGYQWTVDRGLCRIKSNKKVISYVKIKFSRFNCSSTSFWLKTGLYALLNFNYTI